MNSIALSNSLSNEKWELANCKMEMKEEPDSDMSSPQSRHERSLRPSDSKRAGYYQELLGGMPGNINVLDVEKSQKSSSTVSISSAEKSQQCCYCGKFFSKTTNLSRHKALHKFGKRYSCHECGNRYSTIWYLKIHMARHESNKNQQKCIECGAQFTRRLPWKQFMTLRNKENGQMSSRCDDCLRSESGPHPSVFFDGFICSHCGDLVASKDANQHNCPKVSCCQIPSSCCTKQPTTIAGAIESVTIHRVEPAAEIIEPLDLSVVSMSRKSPDMNNECKMQPIQKIMTKTENMYC